MTQQAPWFVEERALAFASLVLTKRNDVVVRTRAETDRGVDLLVEVLEAGKSTLRFFSVRLVGCMDLPDIQNADERILSDLGRDRLDAELPVCVFVIGVRKPEGIYRWIVEPVVEEGRALLRPDAEANWQPLDEAGAARLIDQVNAWYDARKTIAGPKPHGRQSKTGS